MSELEVLNPTYRVYNYPDNFDYEVNQDDSGFSVSIKNYVPVAKRETFERLRDKWIEETMYFSDPESVYNNENHKTIIRLGYKMLPYILDDLREHHNDWFFALNKITKANPIKIGHAGDVVAMAMDWLEWSENNLAF